MTNQYFEEKVLDAISREAVFKVQAKYAEHMGATKFWEMSDDIKALPFVTPSRRYGRWLKENPFLLSTCSECGNNAIGYHGFAETLTTFCPNCGAKMVEPQERSEENGSD